MTLRLRLSDDAATRQHFEDYWRMRGESLPGRLVKWLETTQAELSGVAGPAWVAVALRRFDKLDTLSLPDWGNASGELVVSWVETCSTLQIELSELIGNRIERVHDDLWQTFMATADWDDAAIVVSTAIRTWSQWEVENMAPVLYSALDDIRAWSAASAVLEYRQTDARLVDDYNSTGGRVTRRKISARAVKGFTKLGDAELPPMMSTWVAHRLAHWKAMLDATTTPGPATRE